MRIFAAQNVDGWVGAVKLSGFKEYLRRKKLVEKYCKKRDFIYGYAVRFNGYEVTPEDLIKEFKKYIEIGVTWINIRIDPDTENLELLDKIAKVIRYFKESIS